MCSVLSARLTTALLFHHVAGAALSVAGPLPGLVLVRDQALRLLREARHTGGEGNVPLWERGSLAVLD